MAIMVMPECMLGSTRGWPGGWFEVTFFSQPIDPVLSPLVVSGYLQELLNRSEVALQETFAPSMGLLYSQNAPVFSDLYVELRRYCRTSNVNLEEALNDFWARLLEKLFNQANQQYIIVTYTMYRTVRPQNIVSGT
ncbi:unnamed protein product [Arctogadus glacialis]